MPTSKSRPTWKSPYSGAPSRCSFPRARSRPCERGSGQAPLARHQFLREDAHFASRMNRYPLWKYIVIAFALVIGIVYTLPNFFPEAPAVQVSTSKSNVKIDTSTLQTVEDVLKAANVPYTGETVDPTGVKVRFADPDTQLKARDVLQGKLNPDPNNQNYIVALNLESTSPRVLTAIHALPMFLGLDLRGGVHFLEQVDMKAALDKAADRYLTDIRLLMREKKVIYAGIARDGPTVIVRFRDPSERARAFLEIGNSLQD